MIQLQHINKSFQHGTLTTEILNDINLYIPQGQWISVVGPSGTGKTTLLHCMTGLMKPNSGYVRYDDTELYKLNDKKRSDFRLNHIGFVFQDFKLLPHYSVLDNVIMPLLYHRSKKELNEEAKNLLLRLGINGAVFGRLPESLSGGEKQRVAVARALIADPKILVCDEPTGNLDRENRDQLTTLFQHLHNQGKTIIMVTHDMKVAVHGQEIYHLLDGSLTQNKEVHE